MLNTYYHTSKKQWSNEVLSASSSVGNLCRVHRRLRLWAIELNNRRRWSIYLDEQVYFDNVSWSHPPVRWSTNKWDQRRMRRPYARLNLLALNHVQLEHVWFDRRTPLDFQSGQPHESSSVPNLCIDRPDLPFCPRRSVHAWDLGIVVRLSPADGSSPHLGVWRRNSIWPRPRHQQRSSRADEYHRLVSFWMVRTGTRKQNGTEECLSLIESKALTIRSPE